MDRVSRERQLAVESAFTGSIRHNIRSIRHSRKRPCPSAARTIQHDTGLTRGRPACARAACTSSDRPCSISPNTASACEYRRHFPLAIPHQSPHSERMSAIGLCDSSWSTRRPSTGGQIKPLATAPSGVAGESLPAGKVGSLALQSLDQRIHQNRVLRHFRKMRMGQP